MNHIFILILLFCFQMHIVNAETRINSKKSAPPDTSSEMEVLTRTPSEVETQPETDSMGNELIDRTQSHIQNLTDQLDLLLGGQRADDISDSTTARFMTLGRFEKNKKTTENYKVNLATKMSSLNRWQTKILKWLNGKETELEEDIEKDIETHLSKKNKIEFENTIHTLSKPHSTSSKIQKQNSWYFTIDKNIEYHSIDHIGFYLHGRIRKDFKIGRSFNSAAQDFGWDSENQWESLGALTNNFQLTRNLLFTFHQNYNWFITKDEFTTGHSVALRWLVNKNSILTFESGIGTKVISKDWFADFYFVKTIYRQAYFKNKFYIQLSPFIEFHKILNYKDSPGILASVELRI